MSEYDQQVTTVSWYKRQYPKYKKCIWATVNERQLYGTKGQRMGQMVKLKKLGFKSGVSDLTICVPRGTYHGMFLEMKDVGKTCADVTGSQRDHLDIMREMGYFTGWAAGADIAIKMINDYMGLE